MIDGKDSILLSKVVLHPEFETYMVVKSWELAIGMKVKGARKK